MQWLLSILTSEIIISLRNCSQLLGNMSMMANNCTVFVDNMVIYSESDEDYVEFVVTRLKESMAKGEFNGSHPAIVRTTFLDQLTTEGQPVDSTSAVENGGFRQVFPALCHSRCCSCCLGRCRVCLEEEERSKKELLIRCLSIPSRSDCQDKSHQSPARSPTESAPVSSLAIPQVHSSLVIPQVHPGRASPGPTRPALPGHTCTPSICSDRLLNHPRTFRLHEPRDRLLQCTVVDLPSKATRKQLQNRNLTRCLQIA